MIDRQIKRSCKKTIYQWNIFLCELETPIQDSSEILMTIF